MIKLYTIMQAIHKEKLVGIELRTGKKIKNRKMHLITKNRISAKTKDKDLELVA